MPPLAKRLDPSAQVAASVSGWPVGGVGSCPRPRACRRGTAARAERRAATGGRRGQARRLGRAAASSRRARPARRAPGAARRPPARAGRRPTSRRPRTGRGRAQSASASTSRAQVISVRSGTAGPERSTASRRMPSDAAIPSSGWRVRARVAAAVQVENRVRRPGRRRRRTSARDDQRRVHAQRAMVRDRAPEQVSPRAAGAASDRRTLPGRPCRAWRRASTPTRCTRRSCESWPRLSSSRIAVPDFTCSRDRAYEYSRATIWSGSAAAGPHATDCTCEEERSGAGQPLRPRSSLDQCVALELPGVRDDALRVELQPLLEQRDVDGAEVGGRLEVAVGVERRRPGNSPTRCRRVREPIRNAAPAAPWSVPPEPFSCARRPNSDQTSVSTRSAIPRASRSRWNE